MLSTEEYLLSWGMYLLSVLGLMIVWWHMSSWVRPPVLRNVLRITALVALVTPYPVPGQESFLAPAFMMTFLEGLFFEAYGFAHAGIPLILAVVIANIVYLMADLIWQMFRRRRPGDGEDSPETQSPKHEPTSERKTPTLS